MKWSCWVVAWVLGGMGLAAQQLPPLLSPAELTIWMDGRVAPLVPAAPSPPNTATNVPITPVTLTWTSIGGRTYNVCFNTSGSFPSNTCRLVSTNTWTTPALVAGGTYYWRINSRNSYSGSGVNGPVWSFTTATAPAPPPLALACPANPPAVNASSPAGIIVTLPSATVTGGTPPITTTYAPASGTVFPVGTTPVTVTATDSGAQSRTCTFSVTVNPPVTIPPPPEGYVAEFWNSTSTMPPAIPTTPSVFSRIDPVIDFDWGANSPAQNVNADYWLARWTRDLTFTAGVYTFTATSDDGVRVWFDNTLILDQWTTHAPTTYTVTQTVVAGTHRIRVEFFDAAQGALLQFSYATVTTPVATLPATFLTDPYTDPTATYFRFYRGATLVQELPRAQAIAADGTVRFTFQPGQLPTGTQTVTISAVTDLTCAPACEASSTPLTVLVQ